MPITSTDYGAFVGAPNAPRLGDVAPDFEGALIDGGTFSLAQARQAGPVLVMFYRGFW
jgi:peroxiredoxin